MVYLSIDVDRGSRMSNRGGLFSKWKTRNVRPWGSVWFGMFAYVLKTVLAGLVRGKLDSEKLTLFYWSFFCSIFRWKLYCHFDRHR